MENLATKTIFIWLREKFQVGVVLVGVFLLGYGLAKFSEGDWIAMVWLVGGTSLFWWGGWRKRDRERKKGRAKSIPDNEGQTPEGSPAGALWQVLPDLLGADNQEYLVRIALEKAAAVCGASGATFIFLDEWNQPLRVYAVGEEGEVDNQEWEKSLAQPQVRLSCKQCQVYRAAVDQGCTLFQSEMPRAKIVECVPLKQHGRTVAVINLFSTRPNFVLADDLRRALENFFSAVLMGLELHRLKAREAAIYSQILGNRVRHPDLDSTLRPIVWRWMQVSACKGAALYLLQNEAMRLPTFLTVGQFPVTEPERVREVCNLVLKAVQTRPDHPQRVPLEPHGVQGWAIRLVSSQGKDLGVLLLYGFNSSGGGESVSAASSLLLDALVYVIETEQMHFDLAYRAVIQERMRLAREIHDGLAQTLAYLKLNTAQMINALNQEDHARLETLLHRHYQALAEIYLETRQVMDNLRFSPQEDMNTWIRRVAASAMEGMNLQIECILPEKPPDLPLEVQAQLLRIIQEALNNIRKHARASKAWISLSSWDRDWVLEIGDNGVGFTPQDVPQFSQHGLRGMRERAELIGADFQVISQPYQGTIIRLQVPFRVEESLV
ncbi:sensor histidine kinase [uncultured Thermanaerothrix sp.]|uniref:sensor histidine kinase n=1 Tax=uncultured Thermanaerothrix sp. TaxID=1195149 RepID=UPI0026088721|nr:sensor histidine kinase [uncultured Thermanaerothrix sp.]